MIDFFLGALAGALLMMGFLQLATQKIINFACYVDKAEDPKRFWTFTLTYFAGFVSMVVLLLFYDRIW